MTMSIVIIIAIAASAIAVIIMVNKMFARMEDTVTGNIAILREEVAGLKSKFKGASEISNLSHVVQAQFKALSTAREEAVKEKGVQRRDEIDSIISRNRDYEKRIIQLKNSLKELEQDVNEISSHPETKKALAKLILASQNADESEE